ncbi:MAG: hypothetical protein QGG53_38445 [Planctomycetota bacterium]|nr:hypothetical protein [Planctomycetota bacterium]
MLFIFAFSLPPFHLWFSSSLSFALAAPFLLSDVALHRKGKMKTEDKKTEVEKYGLEARLKGRV